MVSNIRVHLFRLCVRFYKYNAGNKKTVANINGKRERYSKMYAFSSMLECGFCGSLLSRRSWHCRSDYRKVVWHCITSIKKGKNTVNIVKD